MKKLTILLLSIFILACATVPQESIVAVSADGIRSNLSVLEGQQMVSTGQPDQGILQAAKEAGYVAVVDLRRESEDRGFDESAAVESLGMSYISLPVAGAEGTTFDNARRLDSILDGIDGPVLLHCASGNRVGALIALRASLNGASDAEALAAGREAGMTRLEETVKERLAED